MLYDNWQWSMHSWRSLTRILLFCQTRLSVWFCCSLEIQIHPQRWNFVRDGTRRACSLELIWAVSIVWLRKSDISWATGSSKMYSATESCFVMFFSFLVTHDCINKRESVRCKSYDIYGTKKASAQIYSLFHTAKQGLSSEISHTCINALENQQLPKNFHGYSVLLQHVVSIKTHLKLYYQGRLVYQSTRTSLR